MLCSDSPVYSACAHPGSACEDDPTGGLTHEGFIQSLVQQYADACSRGLMGDAVRTAVVRHMPVLGGEGSAAQYARWCHALAQGDTPVIEHPSMQGVFLHPLNIALGVLLCGAYCLERQEASVFNLGAGPECLCPNRSAALRFLGRHACTRAVRECEPPCGPIVPFLCDLRARRLCGYRPVIGGDDALDALLALESAREPLEEIRRQTQDFLAMLR